MSATLSKPGFIWTMWDVKYRVAKVRSQKEKGFIWTMWDVKDGGTSQDGRPQRFYLNYVGCKVLRKGKPLWRWQMFYLNYVGCKARRGFLTSTSKPCFIWTMWDVKEKPTLITLSAVDVFYLNYVGCKVKSFINLLVLKACFIWTMWDVKCQKDEEPYSGTPVLSELCGM